MNIIPSFLIFARAKHVMSEKKKGASKQNLQTFLVCQQRVIDLFTDGSVAEKFEDSGDWRLYTSVYISQ